jgi:hypothetical protein
MTNPFYGNMIIGMAGIPYSQVSEIAMDCVVKFGKDV